MKKRVIGKGGGETHSLIIRAGAAARPPLGWRVGPSMMLICIINMVLQVALPTIKLYLPTKQLVLILSVLLLPLINSIEP